MATGIQTKRELEATREKLRTLEKQYAAAGQREGDVRVRGATQRSLMRMIKQLKEEVLYCEAHFGLRIVSAEATGTSIHATLDLEGEHTPMIPDFDENGNLPPGIHRASLDEIEERFGRRPELRRVQMQSLRWLVDLATKVGIERLVINGSFVTDVFEPNDVDCVLLMRRGFQRDRKAIAELEGLPFIHAQLVRGSRFENLVNHIFATDRRGNAKGLIEVIL